MRYERYLAKDRRYSGTESTVITVHQYPTVFTTFSSVEYCRKISRYLYLFVQIVTWSARAQIPILFLSQYPTE